MSSTNADLARILDPEPAESLDDHIERGGGTGLETASTLDAAAIGELIGAAGLRGRGGAAFPTAIKWEAARESGRATTVVVNAAEGEPGSFKDRTLLRRNPYRVLEGAVIAALATGADRIVVGVKRSFRPERHRLGQAIMELRAAGWLTGFDVELVLGPDLYLFGEETALLEVAAGRPPFPRLVPPFRRGLDSDSTGGSAADTPTAHGEDSGEEQPPLAVNNVETLANVAWILANGPDAFRSLGTEASPGTIVCTVSGDTVTHGVGEVALGTPVDEIIRRVGGGYRAGRRPVALLSGVSHPFLPASRFHTPATYDDLTAAGSGLGAASFVVFDDSTDLVSAAQGVARFLAVQSCGQCEPCKRDGLAIAELLDDIRRGDADEGTTASLDDRLLSVDQGARCYLAIQQRVVIDGLLASFPEALARRMEPSASPAPALTVTEIDDLIDGRVVIDPDRRERQPDWGFGPDTGQYPAARFEHRDLTRDPGFASDHGTDRPGARPAVPVRDDGSTVAFGTGGPGAGGGEGQGADTTPSVTGLDDEEVVVDLRRQLAHGHHDLISSLSAVAGASPGTPAEHHALDRFSDALIVHTRAVDQVLLPMARRVAPEAGEVAGERAERHEEAARELLGGLRNDDDRYHHLHELAGDLRRLILDEEERVIPLLERNLSQAELDDLGRAFHEARLMAESVA